MKGLGLFLIILFILVISYFTENSEKEYQLYIEENSEKWFPNIVKYIKNSIKNYKVVDNKNNADIIVYNILNNDFIKNKINIIISGETYNVDNNVDLYIGSLTQKIGKKHIYYPFMYSSLFNRRKSNNEFLSDKNKFCAYMYSVSHEHRIEIFNLISKYKKVDALGKCSKNTDNIDTRFIENDDETYNDIAVDLYKNYKFVIAMENKDVDGYNTEKLINPIIANSIPLYWGNNKIFKYINKKRVIYIPDYTEEDLIKKIISLDNNIDEYNKIINEPIYTNINNIPENFEKNIEKQIKENIQSIIKNELLF